jgi:hypothetical protein
MTSVCSGKDFEIVMVSGDRNRSQFDEYFGIQIPFNSQALCGSLMWPLRL